MKKSTQLRIFIFAVLFIAFFGVVKITQNIRSEADRELQRETTISATGNDQIKAEQRAKEDLELQRKQAQSNRDFQRFLGKE